MKVLVTGGAGFIGQYLINELRKEHEVIVLDDLSRSKADADVKGDVADYDLISKLVKDVDLVYHLAALSQVIPSINNPDLCFKSNVLGTYNIAKACAEHGKKLVFTSSREVYGESERLPVSENSELKSENPYGASKIAGEALIKGLKVDHVILRLANVIGKGDKDRVLPIFVSKALNNEEITVYDENKIIDFINVKDVVNALIKAQGVRNEIINVGSGVGTTLGDLVKLIIKLTNSKSKIIYSERPGEVSKYVADISKAKLLLNWEPKVPLIDSINELISS